jgi:hypothetical protein
MLKEPEKKPATKIVRIARAAAREICRWYIEPPSLFVLCSKRRAIA